MQRNTSAWILASLAWALRSPRAEFLERDRDNELLSALGQASMQCPGSQWSMLFDQLWKALERMATGDAALLLEKLEVEHTRLFYGPPIPAVLPYEHAYRKGGDAAKTCTSLETRYRRMGFEVKDDFRDLKDHICVQLEFAATLVQMGLDVEAETFRVTHLQDLLLGFGQNLQSETRSVFFGTIAQAVLGMAAEEDWCSGTRKSEEIQR